MNSVFILSGSLYCTNDEPELELLCAFRTEQEACDMLDECMERVYKCQGEIGELSKTGVTYFKDPDGTVEKMIMQLAKDLNTLLETDVLSGHMQLQAEFGYDKVDFLKEKNDGN